MRRFSEDKTEIIRIGIPAILDSLIAVIVTTIDTQMISGLGKNAVSAVSLTTQPKLLVLALFYALGTAASIFVSQALGRKNRDEANEYFHSIFRITAVLSLVLGLLLALLADPVMRLCSQQKETLEASVGFFRIIMGFIVFQTISIVLNAALRGIGKTGVTLAVTTRYEYSGFDTLTMKNYRISTVSGGE